MPKLRRPENLVQVFM